MSRGKKQSKSSEYAGPSFTMDMTDDEIAAEILNAQHRLEEFAEECTGTEETYPDESGSLPWLRRRIGL